MPSVNDLILTITHNAQQTTSSTVDYHGNKYLSNYIAEEPEQMKPKPNNHQIFKSTQNRNRTEP